MKIKEALNESIPRGQITSAEFDGPVEALLVALHEYYDGEIDYCIVNSVDVDVWGFQEASPDWSMDWRLSVTLT